MSKNCSTLIQRALIIRRHIEYLNALFDIGEPLQMVGVSLD